MKFSSISRAKHSMGSNESKDLKSIVKFIFGLLLLLFHFVFVVCISKLFDFWRSLAHDDKKTGLQGELDSTNKEGEFVRQRLRFQDEQLEKVKERQDLSAEEEQNKYGK
jgi:hypothetical protein